MPIGVAGVKPKERAVPIIKVHRDVWLKLEQASEKKKKKNKSSELACRVLA